jgi:hypothetical protein
MRDVLFNRRNQVGKAPKCAETNPLSLGAPRGGLRRALRMSKAKATGHRPNRELVGVGCDRSRGVPNRKCRTKVATERVKTVALTCNAVLHRRPQKRTILSNGFTVKAVEGRVYPGLVASGLAAISVVAFTCSALFAT